MFGAKVRLTRGCMHLVLTELPSLHALIEPHADRRMLHPGSLNRCWHGKCTMHGHALPFGSAVVQCVTTPHAHYIDSM